MHYVKLPWFSIKIPTSPKASRNRLRRAAEFEHRPGAVGPLQGHDDVGGVLDGNDDASEMGEPGDQVTRWPKHWEEGLPKIGASPIAGYSWMVLVRENPMKMDGSSGTIW